jgi:hypothetical protein
MEILALTLLILFVGALSIALGDDSRPSEHDHVRNW